MSARTSGVLELPTPSPPINRRMRSSGRRRRGWCACVVSDHHTACDGCVEMAGDLARKGCPLNVIMCAMEVPEGRAILLVGIAEQRRELETLRMDRVPTQGLRILLVAAGAYGPLRTGDVRANAPVIVEGRMPHALLTSLAAELRTRAPMTAYEIAKAAGYPDASSMSRKVGVVAEPLARRASVHGEPRFSDTIDVGEAGAIVRAMGLVPSEIPWL